MSKTYHHCLNSWCRTRMKRTRATIADGYYEDIDGGKHPEYEEYTCPACGNVRTFIVSLNAWANWNLDDDTQEEGT